MLASAFPQLPKRSSMKSPADHLGARRGAAQRGLTSGEILRQLLPSVILVFEDEGDVLL